MLLRGVIQRCAVNKRQSSYKAPTKRFSVVKSAAVQVRTYSFFSEKEEQPEVAEETKETTNGPTATTSKFTYIGAEIERVEPNVLKITSGDRTIHVVGTTSVSVGDAGQVEDIIKEVKPDVVGLQLCEYRVSRLTTTAGLFNSRTVKNWPYKYFGIRKYRNLHLVSRIMSSVSTGPSSISAFDTACNMNTKVALMDYRFSLVIGETMDGLALDQRAALKDMMSRQMPNRGDMNRAMPMKEFDLSTISQHSDIVDEAAELVSEAWPTMHKRVVDKRALYFIHCLQNGTGENTVAVGGVSMLSHIKRYWEPEAFERRALDLGLDEDYFKRTPEMRRVIRRLR